jgi:hypothetical protein
MFLSLSQFVASAIFFKKYVLRVDGKIVALNMHFVCLGNAEGD